ncbi:hypothetical protein [Bradyrhizobium sp. ORS 375]|uniref:hypothetical protein n=1 Tax=Bradyrhizobium sp. (strain ORS 375) TaxID=566679 RepID=UPI001585C311|nr:hypothetical protein [Bradyrhizobium sp. ORS 375]
MTITSVDATEDGIVIGGTIMGAMPMKGVVRGDELRAGYRFLSWALVVKALRMVLGGK